MHSSMQQLWFTKNLDILSVIVAIIDYRVGLYLIFINETFCFKLCEIKYTLDFKVWKKGENDKPWLNWESM